MVIGRVVGVGVDGRFGEGIQCNTPPRVTTNNHIILFYIIYINPCLFWSDLWLDCGGG